MSDPLIAHWLQGIAARGEICDQYIHANDILPMLLDAIGIDAPATLADVPQTPLEGASFAHTFADARAP